MYKLIRERDRTHARGAYAARKNMSSYLTLVYAIGPACRLVKSCSPQLYGHFCTVEVMVGDTKFRLTLWKLEQEGKFW